MYKVYCDSWLLYTPTMDELKLINPKLDLEVNKQDHLHLQSSPDIHTTTD